MFILMASSCGEVLLLVNLRGLFMHWCAHLRFRFANLLCTATLYPGLRCIQGMACLVDTVSLQQAPYQLNMSSKSQSCIMAYVILR